jgi:transcriptional regulator with XRE-family HTH domain
MRPRELKKIRYRFGLSQRSLARLLEVSQVTVARWETGKQKISRLAQLAVYQIISWFSGEVPRLQRKIYEVTKNQKHKKRKKAGQVFPA